MKNLFLLLLFSSILYGCGNRQEMDAAQKAKQDSLALKVALMPTLDCLPFYYADRCGMFKDLGLDIRLHTFNAQMDCDTAFARKHVDVCYTDLIRAALLQSKGTGLHVFMQADGHHELITAKNKRIRSISQLKERMIGMARHSVTDLLLDTVIGQSRLDAATVYHPQINDIVLRYDMLRNTTLDAAFLPEPYATQSRIEGNKSIYDSREKDIRLMAFMVSDEALKDERKTAQLQLLIKGYNLAAEAINRQENADSIRHILAGYPVSTATTDSLKLPAYTAAGKVSAKQVSTALHFLTYRNQIRPPYTGDTLVNTKLIP